MATLVSHFVDRIPVTSRGDTTAPRVLKYCVPFAIRAEAPLRKESVDTHPGDDRARAADESSPFNALGDRPFGQVAIVDDLANATLDFEVAMGVDPFVNPLRWLW